MIVHGNGQLVSPTQAAAFENSLPIFSCHALSKTVNANAAANFGLISPFWHYSFLSNLNNFIFVLQTFIVTASKQAFAPARPISQVIV